MMNTNIHRILLVLAFYGTSVLQPSDAESQKLLVILLDGFRWDYVEKLNLPNFKWLYDHGARAEHVLNDYPTLSYPNYYSIMTGLHTESHGMTGNYMYDKTRNETFLIGTNPEQYNAHWWDGGEPLWVAAVKQGKKAYMYYWLGCEVTILGITPTFCEQYTRVTTLDDFKHALNESLDFLSNGTTHLAAVYHEQPDYVGHKYGPDSEELASTVRDIDSYLGKVFTEISEMPEDERVNVLIMSDHGMTSIGPERTINLTNTLNDPALSLVIMESGAVASIYVPDTNKIDQVFSLIQNFSSHMTVYKRADIPARLYYKHGKYVGDITCVADLGWTILHHYAPTFPKKGDTNFHGSHGYDNQETDMYGIFYAYGPYFKAGSKVSYIRVNDPYNLMCEILDITPAPNNGTASRYQPLLATGAGNDVTSLGLVVMAAICLLTLSLW